MKDISIRPLDNFSTNGKLSGPLGAFDPDDLTDLLWEGDYSNWRKDGVVEDAATKMVEELQDSPEYEVDHKRAVDLLRKALRLARKVQQEASEELEDSMPPPTDRKMVITNGRFIREIAEEAWGLLQPVDGRWGEFYRFGNNISHLETEGAEQVYAYKLRRDSLIGHLDRLADFYALRKNKTGQLEYHPDKPPKDVVDVMLAEAVPPLPRLQAVVNTPVIAPDGSCLTEDGYHPEVELYLYLNGLTIPTVPDQPLSSDIERAKNLVVSELLGDFPFTTTADLAHAVAAMLTHLVRPMIDGPVPLILIEAPSPGTGKGLLAEAVVFIVTGGYAKVMTEAKGEEWRKRITSALVELPAVILIDNLRQHLDSAHLAAVLTSRTWTDRELGASRNITVRVRSTFIATGNNVSLSAEMARRTVLSRIDSAAEKPWERQGFRHDPLMPWVSQHRGELLWALLTMVRFWITEGRPVPKERIGSFEEWSAVVGGILMACGIPGFLENRSAVYSQAQAEGEAWRAFMVVWWDEYQDIRVGTPELFELAKKHKLLTELRAGTTEHGARVALGMSIAGIRDRRIGDFWVRDAGQKHGGGASYRLEQVDVSGERDPEKDSPDYTDSPQPHAWDGESGETSESFLNPHGGGKHKPICEICDQEVEVDDMVYTTSGGLRHEACEVSP